MVEVRKEEPSDAAIGLVAGRMAVRERPTAVLADLMVGSRARIVAVDGDAILADRLRELGFCAGTEISLERRAPLGDPVVYRLRGTRIALRRSEAGLIKVRELGDAG